MASLSYDPATEREMYPGTIPMNAAASRLADGDAISDVKLEMSPSHRDRLRVDSQVGRDRCQSGKGGSEHYTDISNIHRHVDHSQEAPNETGCDHQTRVDGSSDRSTERIPCGRVKPVPEFLVVS